jgi:hypothetical protein
MGTVLAHIGALGEAIMPGRRKVARAIVQVEASVTSSRGDSAKMTINNVSTYGCNITGDAGWLKMGSFVGVALEGGQPLQAIVRWLRDDSAGLEFLRPVPAGNAAWHDVINSVSNM